MVPPLGSLVTVAAKRWIRAVDSSGGFERWIRAVDSSGGFEGDELANHWKGGQPIPVAVALAVHVEDCVDAA